MSFVARFVILVAAVFVANSVVFTPAAAEPSTDSKLTPTLEAKLAATPDSARILTIVQFDSFGSRDLAPLADFGVDIGYTLVSIPAYIAWVPADQVRLLAQLPEVILIENNDPIEYDLDTAIVAANVTPLWAAETPTITLNGTVIDGSGITVAVVDTGVNAQHPDLEYETKVVSNVMAVTLPEDPLSSDPMNGQVIEWRDTDDSDGGGHGSHVAGIVAGNGVVSDGRYRGSAPGATIAGLGSKNADFSYAVAAWDWVFQNAESVSPPIRIITNSWGYTSGQPCDEAISLTKIQKRLVLEKDIVMFFSAGNTGGNGDRDTSRTQFKCPWEGNIGVGNYFDFNQGLRDWYQSNSSARGDRNDTSTWPDISAPGSSIMATNGYPVTSGQGSFLVGCQLPQMLDVELPVGSCYAALSGTSMSTPFAAGVGAMILQARPDLKPADVEYILEQTAYKWTTTYEDVPTDYYADPNLDYRHHGSHYFKGHGLIDAARAVQFAMTYTSGDVVYEEREAPQPRARVQPIAAKGVDEASTPGIGVLAALVLIAGVAWSLRRN